MKSSNALKERPYRFVIPVETNANTNTKKYSVDFSTTDCLSRMKSSPWIPVRLSNKSRTATLDWNTTSWNYSNMDTSLVILSNWASTICMHTVTRTFGFHSPFDVSCSSQMLKYCDNPHMRFNECRFLKKWLTHQCMTCHTMAWDILKHWTEVLSQ